MNLNQTQNVFDTSIGYNTKVLYNVTNKFRLGGEIGISLDSYGNYLKNNTTIADSVGMFMLGLTGEYDIYQDDTLAIYLNGSLGAAYNETKIKYDSFFNCYLNELTAKSYAKLGLGTRFNTGLGLEFGSKALAYDYARGSANDHMERVRGLTYFELNYTF